MSNKKDLFKDRKPGDILEILESTAYLKEKTTVDLEYMPGEIEQFKESLAKSAAELHEHAADLSRVKGKYKALMDPLKKEIARCAEALSDKTYETEAVLYGMADYEAGTMDFYNEAGKYIRSRPLKATERQGSIHSITSKTA